MNCTGIEKLLPLYVEGDLSGPEAGRVGSHLSSCDDCRAIAEEFAVSQERLRNFDVPEFGAEFYEQLRGAVMREISSKPAARPAIFQTLRAFFTLRPALAASLATLMLFCALSLAIYRSLVKDEPGFADIEVSLGNPTDMPSVDKARPVNNKVGSKGAGPQSYPARDASRRRRLVQDGVPPRASSTRIVDSTGSNAEQKQQAVRQSGGVSTDEASRQVVARMDIQTSDPNIRIIWLGRKASE